MIFQDLSKLLQTFDASDEKYLNKIIKELKSKAKSFQVENFIKESELKLNKCQFETESTTYYEKHIV